MRLDTYLCENSLAKSRTQAKDLILAGLVTVDGKVIKKPAWNIESETVEVTGELCPYVSRGGLKLEKALEIFDVDVYEKECIDVGASTGGFTDCLLQNGAKSVLCIDCGHGQLDQKIEKDKRVKSIEGFNARNLSYEAVEKKFDIAVMDVSFISQTLILPGVYDVLKNNGELISLIKPQFECGKEALNDKGIVKDDAMRMASIYKVISKSEELGFTNLGILESPIKGGDGNTEYLIHLRKDKA